MASLCKIYENLFLVLEVELSLLKERMAKKILKVKNCLRFVISNQTVNLTHISISLQNNNKLYAL